MLRFDSKNEFDKNFSELNLKFCLSESQFLYV